MHKSQTSYDNPEDFLRLLDQLSSWDVPEKAVDRLYDAARMSLNEVKALTEYEDGKVARLLTIVAFLSAVIGAVFTRFASDYIWPGFPVRGSALIQLLPALTYIVFFIYVVLVTWSTCRVIGAVRPRFNVPATWSGSAKSGLPGSMLFYETILDVSAPQWGKAFETLTGDDAKKLREYYAKNYIAEAYLIAEKVAKKLKVLEPGINGLRIAMVVLIAFFVLYASTILAFGPTYAASRRLNSSSTEPFLTGTVKSSPSATLPVSQLVPQSEFHVDFDLSSDGCATRDRWRLLPPLVEHVSNLGHGVMSEHDLMPA
jgi:hypothetical protein